MSTQPRSPLALMRSHKNWRVPTSTPVVGSSRKHTLGSHESEMAAISLRRVPPDSFETHLLACSCRPNSAITSFAERPRQLGEVLPLEPLPRAALERDHAGDAEHQADERSFTAARLADPFFAATLAPAAADPPRWATVAPGEKLNYAHALPDGATADVPPGERGRHVAKGPASDRLTIEVRPTGDLDAGLLAERALPVMVAAGKEPGPTLLLIAGEHGNEYESIASLQTLMNGLDTATFTGTVVAVPITNVDSFVNNQRIGQDDGKNLARCWPGRADGTLTERVAFALQRDFLNVEGPHKPQFMVALHTCEEHKPLAAPCHPLMVYCT